MLKDYEVIEHADMGEFLALVEQARTTAPREARSESIANLSLMPENVSTDPLNRRGRNL